MRILLLAVIILVSGAAACGSPPCPKPPERVNAEEIRAIQNRICDCKDAACVEGFRPELEGLTIGFYQAAALYVAIDECSTGGRAVIEELEVLRDKACSCKSPECTEEVRVAYAALLEDHRDTKSSARQAQQIGLLATELAGCVERADAGFAD